MPDKLTVLRLLVCPDSLPKNYPSSIPLLARDDDDEEVTYAEREVCAPNRQNPALFDRRSHRGSTMRPFGPRPGSAPQRRRTGVLHPPNAIV